MEKIQLKPFLKWAGGKSQLLNDIRNLYPDGLGKTITKYAEPFVGGGAVLFDILSSYNMKEIYISDINKELINTYCVVRDDVDSLLSLLHQLEKEYLPLDHDQRKDYYIKKRARFNELKMINDVEKELVETAALMIFLNRTCFNGLYRVNKSGRFNVPIGAYKKPRICDSENLRLISSALQNVKIEWGDYKQSAGFIDAQTFVYFDPPFRSLHQTANFVSYNEVPFDDSAQCELAEFVKEMDKKGAKIAVSNSDPQNLDTDDYFFDDLYKGFHISRVQAARMINSNGKGRGKISELLISNSLGGVHMEIREENQLVKKGTKKAIIEFVIADYIVYVFQGNLTQFDIVIKYKKEGKRIRTPKHIHWVIDILMKMQGNEKLTKQYLSAIQNCWNTCEPLKNNDYETLKKLIEDGEADINISQYSELNTFGEYDVEFLYILMELLAVQEKTNRADAFMFGKIIKELLKSDRDIFSIISTAGFNGRKG